MTATSGSFQTVLTRVWGYFKNQLYDQDTGIFLTGGTYSIGQVDTSHDAYQLSATRIDLGVFVPGGTIATIYNQNSTDTTGVTNAVTALTNKDVAGIQAAFAGVGITLSSTSTIAASGLTLSSPYQSLKITDPSINDPYIAIYNGRAGGAGLVEIYQNTFAVDVHTWGMALSGVKTIDGSVRSARLNSTRAIRSAPFRSADG